MLKRPFAAALFAASLYFACTLGLACTLAAQQPAKHPKAPANLNNDQLLSEQLQRAEEDPRLAAERDQMDRQLNRDLLEMRRNIMQESMNRMNRARYHESFDTMRLITDCMSFAVFVILLCALLWLIRTIIESRRWSRVAQIQTDIHGKLLEKMSSSQELLAYMDTEAGKRFLESSPFEIESRARPGLPLGRILLPAQAGVVILFIGAASVWLQDRLPEDAQGLLLFGILCMALGIGLVFSAGLAYSLSKHLGLNAGNNQ